MPCSISLMRAFVSLCHDNFVAYSKYPYLSINIGFSPFEVVVSRPSESGTRKHWFLVGVDHGEVCVGQFCL